MSDIRLHWTERGQGAPLILLHGNGEDGGYFENQLAHFSKNRRVIAPDTRGHGQSPRGGAPFTIRQFAEDLLIFSLRLGHNSFCSGSLQAKYSSKIRFKGFSEQHPHPQRHTHVFHNDSSLPPDVASDFTHSA